MNKTVLMYLAIFLAGVMLEPTIRRVPVLSKLPTFG